MSHDNSKQKSLASSVPGMYFRRKIFGDNRWHAPPVHYLMIQVWLPLLRMCSALNCIVNTHLPRDALPWKVYMPSISRASQGRSSLESLYAIHLQSFQGTLFPGKFICHPSPELPRDVLPEKVYMPSISRASQGRSSLESLYAVHPHCSANAEVGILGVSTWMHL